MELLNESEAVSYLERYATALESSYQTLKNGLDKMMKENLGTIPTGLDDDGNGQCYHTVFWILLMSERYGLDLYACHGTVYHPDTGWHGHAWIQTADGHWCADYANDNEKILPTEVYLWAGKIKDLQMFDVERARELALQQDTTGPWDLEEEA